MEGTASKGEGVASSLDDGLRLSPCSENSTLSEKISTNHANGDDRTALIYALPTHDGQEVPSLTANERAIQENNTEDYGEGVTTIYTGQEEQHEVSDPAGINAVDSVATSAYAQPAGTTKGQNEQNENGLICPPGMDLEFF